MNKYNYIELKAELLTNGINATSEALREVGSKYKEQNHGLFGWDFENHANIALPDDFVCQMVRLFSSEGIATPITWSI